MTKFIRMEANPDRYYGNYRGEVVDVDDPLKAQRIRVMVNPVFTDIEKSAIPWATPATSLAFGVNQDQGTVSVPTVGSWVFCFFENGDIYQPVYFACAPAMLNGVPDGPSCARGEGDDISANIAATKITSPVYSEPYVEIKSVYPKATVTKTSGNFLFEVKEGDNDKQLVVYHPSGSRIVMTNDGGVIIHAVGEVNCISNSSNNIYGGASVNIISPVINLDGAVMFGGGTVAPTFAPIVGPIDIQVLSTVNMKSPVIHLKISDGDPVRPVARLGDTVVVDPGTHIGTITSGSATVRAGGGTTVV